MACAALTSLIGTIKIEFLQPRLSLLVHDPPLIKSFLENLSSLQAFLQNKSNGDGDCDGGAVRDLEIEIIDFALKAEDDIELQLSNIILLSEAEDTRKYREKASKKLHQTLQEAAKNAAELSKSCVRERKTATVVLTSLIGTITIEFLQPTSRSRVRLSLIDHDPPLIKSFLENLSSLQDFLQNKSNGDGDGGAVRDLEIEIRDFALKAEDGIELQLSNIILLSEAEDKREDREKASKELHQTLQEAAKKAAELLESCVREREMAIVALTSLIGTIKIEFLQLTPISRASLSLHHRPLIKSFLENLSCLQAFIHNKSNGDGDGDGDGGAARDLEIKIRDFALNAEDHVELQLSNILLSEAEDKREYRETASHELLHQTLRKAAKNAAEKASVYLTILFKKFKHYFLQHFPTEYVGVVAEVFPFLEKLLRDYCLLRGNSNFGAAIKKLETKIRTFALKAKDDIQIQLSIFLLLLAEHNEHEEETSQKLYQTLQEAAESAEELLNIIKHAAAASKSANAESDGSSHCFLKPEDRMVGRHRDCTVIKKKLLSSSSQLQIIAIVGMVGIGKTTVARNVYEDPSVASHFDVRAWVSIPPPQHYNMRRMLRQLLQSIKPEEPNVIKKGSTPDELQMLVRECLRGRKYLIVLDNIMSSQTWTDILTCVQGDNNHRGDHRGFILLTTRHFNRFNYWNKYIHRMTLLDPKESWELFCNNIRSIDEEHLAPKFEKIRNRVVEKCDGLPQLIVEVAKRLSKCSNIQQGWKKIEKELESLGILDRNAIAVNYNPLPHHLKVCFLYFGVFPKRKQILVKMLMRLWIAEGFVKPLKHKELEDQAYKYLQDLIDGSLLLIEDRSCTGKIKTCRVHSALHSFCVVEAQKEGILCAVNTQQHSGLSLKAFTNSCRWLSFYSHSFDYYVLFGTNIPRSIFFFHENPEMLVPPNILRVLAFDTSISLQRVPVQFGKLVFLRYLSITQWFGDLDDVVSNNPNLETLVVYGNGAPTVQLPSSIWKPPHLRHLELGNSYMVDPPSADINNLQTLSWVVRPIHCRKEVCHKLPSITKLKIFVKDETEESSHGGGSCRNNPIILDNLCYFENLKKLSISVSIGCAVTLAGMSTYPRRLNKLSLSGTNLSERDFTIIGKFPLLEVLKLENALHGTVWKVAGRGFTLLKFLILEDKKLKQWEWEACGSYPMLKGLVLKFCYCLKEIPLVFNEMFTLELIVVEKCCSSVISSTKRIVEAQSEYKRDSIQLKILGPIYDESQSTDTEVPPIEDNLAS